MPKVLGSKLIGTTLFIECFMGKHMQIWDWYIWVLIQSMVTATISVVVLWTGVFLGQQPAQKILCLKGELQLFKQNISVKRRVLQQANKLPHSTPGQWFRSWGKKSQEAHCLCGSHFASVYPIMHLTMNRLGPPVCLRKFENSLFSTLIPRFLCKL